MIHGLHDPGFPRKVWAGNKKKGKDKKRKFCRRSAKKAPEQARKNAETTTKLKAEFDVWRLLER